MQERNQSEIVEEEQQSCVWWMFFERGFPCKTPFSLKIYARIGFLIFLILAIVTFVVNSHVKSSIVHYAVSNKCQKTKIASDKCSIDFTVEEDMPGPVYLLYFVENIYINHKKYIASYSVDQLSGTAIDIATA